MQIDEPVALADDFLLCPSCGQEFLHSGRVLVFDRQEDAEETSLVIVDSGTVSAHPVSSAESANPSSRRHGIAIEFECETCVAILQLTLAQHKGHTIARWRGFRPASSL